MAPKSTNRVRASDRVIELGAKEKEVAIALDGLRRIVRALRLTAREAESRYGVSGAQLFVLQLLAQAPVASLNELATRTLTDQSSVSAVVQRLVAKGLVVRGPSARDARRIHIALSPAGRSLLGRHPDTAQQRLIEGLHALPAPTRRALGRSLTKLNELLGLGETAAGMFFDDLSHAHDRIAGR
ncbi:MAG: MarR family transcriptional regulator [Gemmatimonadota bacterium]|nr:MarR family transcriptional regulator [Gemmatimonadota bacterium]